MSAFVELQRRISRFDTFEPCLPRPAKEPPSGPNWIHEIKHDGFRIVVQKEAEKVRLNTWDGHDFTDRYPLIVDAVRSLPGKSCVLDGEAIVVDQDGLSVFDLLRYRASSMVSPSWSIRMAYRSLTRFAIGVTTTRRRCAHLT
jgi:ATP-dependent DNA ligase